MLQIIPITVITWVILQARSSFSRIPGPNKAHDIDVSLHRKYNPLVRFGPNMVSIADPREVSHVYAFSHPWVKSDFYHVLLMKPRGKPIPGIYAAQDEAVHRSLKRPVAGAYAMSTLVSFEPHVDTAMRVFCEQLESRVGDRSEICDFEKWPQMFAFDVIGELTFSRRLGFLESGEDVNNVMANIWETFKKTSLVTQMPWIDKFWLNNPIQRYRPGGGASPGAAFAMARAQERRQLQKTTDENDWDFNTRDFLSRFMEIEAKDKTVPPCALAAWASSNITAGSDTICIFLRSNELASWKQTGELPYLDAMIEEGSRIHPPFGLPYERVLPKEGATICGNPERWLRCDSEKRKLMENTLLTFGAGHRSCMGKHIAYLEMYKVIPILLQRFDFELVGPDEGGTWDLKNRWLVIQEGFLVRLRRRKME
ncbi:cytochrome P450 [Aspergillus recurvatus]